MEKVIIIGGGISGLVAGVYAQKAGFETEIYEKNTVVGGECTGWDREGYYIDNCIHWLMGTTPGTDLNKIWSDSGALDGVKILTSDKMYTSELNGEKLTLWKDIDRTEKEMVELSPEDEIEIRNLMKNCRSARKVQIPARTPAEQMKIGDLLRMTFTMGTALKMFKVYKGMDTQDLMNRFQHPLIRCTISDFCTKESLAHSFPMSYGNYVSGDGGIPQGGSRAMAQRIRKRFEDLGGKVFAPASVEKIVLNDAGKAIGITLSDGRLIHGDYFVAACDTDYTFSHLLDRERMDDVLREAYEYPEAYPVYGMFQVAFAVDSDVDMLNGEIMMESSQVRFADFVSPRITVKNFNYEPSFAPAGKQILQVMLGMTDEGWKYWSELNRDKEAYRARKMEIAGNILKMLEEKYPPYQGKMKILDVWTPVTYHRYCNAYKGYNQAYTITKQSRQQVYPSPFVKGVDNVIIAGQWMSAPGGLPGAAIQGKYSIQRILKKCGRKTEI